MGSHAERGKQRESRRRHEPLPPGVIPTILAPMTKNAGRAPFYVGVDVGGTNIKAGVVDDDGRPLSHVSAPTEAVRGPEVGLENIARAAEMAIAQSDLTSSALRGVGLATPGTMDIPAGY